MHEMGKKLSDFFGENITSLLPDLVVRNCVLRGINKINFISTILYPILHIYNLACPFYNEFVIKRTYVETEEYTEYDTKI